MKSHHRKCFVLQTFTVFLAIHFLAAVSPESTGEPSRPYGKPADMSRHVKVFILLGQSNMVGMGKVTGGEGSLEFAVKNKNLYPYLIDAGGKWIVRKDVRYVQWMQGKGILKHEWLTVLGRTIGPEIGIGHILGNALDEPILILKTCIGNRSLGWDYLPPGRVRGS